MLSSNANIRIYCTNIVNLTISMLAWVMLQKQKKHASPYIFSDMYFLPQIIKFYLCNIEKATKYSHSNHTYIRTSCLTPQLS